MYIITRNSAQFLKGLFIKGAKCFCFLSMVAAVGCSADEDMVPYGREVEISGASIRNYVPEENKSEEGRDIISADRYKVVVTLQSDNDYALEHGINAQQKNKISNISLVTLSPIVNENGLVASIGDDVSECFLVQQDPSVIDFYQTIEEFLTIGRFRNMRGWLIFTNQNRVVPRNEVIIDRETICDLAVTIDFDNELTVRDTLKVTLMPAE